MPSHFRPFKHWWVWWSIVIVVSANSWLDQTHAFDSGQIFHGYFVLVPYGGVKVGTAGDFNGDGIPDMVAAGNDRAWAYRGKGNGKFEAPIYAGPIRRNFDRHFISTADFNLDGNLDFAVLNSEGISVFLGNGDCTFYNPQTANLNPGEEPIGIATVEINGDGIPDLISANNDGIGLLSIWLGTSTGKFPPEPILIEMEQPVDSIDSGDLNGDGLEDLVFTNSLDDRVVVRFHQGDGSFSKEVNFSTGVEPSDVVIGDFNDDGVLDIAACNRVSQDVSVLIGIGMGLFADEARYGFASAPEKIEKGDFNGDDITDLAVTSPGDELYGDVNILVGLGDGAFESSQTISDTNWSSSSVADFNGDGRSDLALVSTFKGFRFLWRAPMGSSRRQRCEIPVGQVKQSQMISTEMELPI